MREVAPVASQPLHPALQSPATFCLTGSSLSPSGLGSGVSLSPLKETKFAGR